MRPSGCQAMVGMADYGAVDNIFVLPRFSIKRPRSVPALFQEGRSVLNPLILLVGAAGFEPATPSPPDW